MSNETATPATRNVSQKYFVIEVNGSPVYVRAKTRTAAIRTALESQNVTARVLTPTEILESGLTPASFVQAPDPAPKATPAE